MEEWGLHIRGPNELCYLIFDTFAKTIPQWTPEHGFRDLDSACDTVNDISLNIPRFLRQLDEQIAGAVARPPDVTVPSECRFRGQAKKHIMLPLLSSYHRVEEGGVISIAS